MIVIRMETCEDYNKKTIPFLYKLKVFSFINLTGSKINLSRLLVRS